MCFRHDVNTLNDWATGDSGLPEEQKQQKEEEQQQEKKKKKMMKLRSVSQLLLEVHTACFDCTCVIANDKDAVCQESNQRGQCVILSQEIKMSGLHSMER